jgi:DnaJ-class molecular chaperone
MNLSFIEAARGLDKEMTVSVMDSCNSCKGSGSEPGSSPERYIQTERQID